MVLNNFLTTYMWVIAAALALKAGGFGKVIIHTLVAKANGGQSSPAMS